MDTEPFPYSTRSLPDAQSSAAIKEFLEDGRWPEPGSMPVRFEFRSGYLPSCNEAHQG